MKAICIQELKLPNLSIKEGETVNFTAGSPYGKRLLFHINHTYVPLSIAELFNHFTILDTDIVQYEKCEQCEMKCRCCGRSSDSCTACANGLAHNFEPMSHYSYCPLDGTAIREHATLVGKWIAYKVKGNDAVMHGQVVDFPQGWYIQVKKKHNRTNMVELANVIKVFDSKEECYAYK